MYFVMSERGPSPISQEELEQELRAVSSETAIVLDDLEKEKIEQDVSVDQKPYRSASDTLQDPLEKAPSRKTSDFIVRPRDKITRRNKSQFQMGNPFPDHNNSRPEDDASVLKEELRELGVEHADQLHNSSLSEAAALKLIEQGEGDLVVKSLDQCRGLDQKNIISALIENGQGYVVAQRPDKFDELGCEEVAYRLINSGYGEDVAFYVNNFSGVSHIWVASQLIRTRQSDALMEHLNKFVGLDQNQVALMLIESNQGFQVADNLWKFGELNGEIALKLIQDHPEYGTDVMSSFYKFKELDRTKIAYALIEAGEGDVVAEYINSFSELDHSDIAHRLMASGAQDSVIENLFYFHCSFDNEFALQLIQAGGIKKVGDCLNKFEVLDNEIAVNLIESGYSYTVIMGLKRFPKLDLHETAIKIIDAGEGTQLLQNLEKFGELDMNEIAKRLISVGSGADLAKLLSRLHGLNSEIAISLIQEGHGASVVCSCRSFEALDDREVVLKLIETGQTKVIVDWTNQLLKGIDKEIAAKLIDEGYVTEVVSKLRQYISLNKEIALRLVEAGKASEIIRHLRQFEGLDNQIAIALIEAGHTTEVLDNIEKFEGLDRDVAVKLLTTFDSFIKCVNKLSVEVAKNQTSPLNILSFDLSGVARGHLAEIIATNDLSLITRTISLFPAMLSDKALTDSEIESLNSFASNRIINRRINDILELYKVLDLEPSFPGLVSIARESLPILINSNNLSGIATLISLFPTIFLDKQFQESLSGPLDNFATRNIRDRKFDDIFELHKLLGFSPSKAFVLAYQIFGNFLSEEIFVDVRALLNGQISETLKGFGVTHTGEAGLNDLKEKLLNVRSAFVEQNYHGEYLETPTMSSLFQEFIGYKTSQWGSHDQDSFNRTVTYHRALVESGKFEDLPETYKPSGILNIDRVDRVQQLTYQYTEQFVGRFNTLKESILTARQRIESPHPLGSLAESCDQIRASLISELQNKLAEMNNGQENPKAIEGLSKRIDSLLSINFRSVEDFENNFTLLSNFKEFHESLRQFVFLLAFRNNRESRTEAEDNLTPNLPSIDNIAWTLEFIDHITNQETRDKYFQAPGARKFFLQITNAKALAEELSLAQNQDIIGKTKMQFIPTRGLLLEFSGHIAGACWASKQTSIAEKHPNICSVTMVKNPDSSSESLAGACMLIRTESAQGEPLLIIRGLNPAENVINQLSVPDFFEKFTEYLKGIAQTEGRKLAIVKDGRGHASTNRQVIADFIDHVNLGERVTLASSQDTTFNSYDITGKTYLLTGQE